MNMNIMTRFIATEKIAEHPELFQHIYNYVVDEQFTEDNFMMLNEIRHEIINDAVLPEHVISDNEFATIINILKDRKTRILGNMLMWCIVRQHNMERVHRILSSWGLIPVSTEALYLLGDKILYNDTLMESILNSIMDVYAEYTMTFYKTKNVMRITDRNMESCVINAYHQCFNTDDNDAIISIDDIFRNIGKYHLRNVIWHNIKLSWNDIKTIMALFLRLNKYDNLIDLTIFDIVQRDNYACNNWLSQIMEIIARESKTEQHIKPNELLGQIREEIFYKATYTTPSLSECVKYILNEYNTTISRHLLHNSAFGIIQACIYKLLIRVLTGKTTNKNNQYLYMYDVKFELSRSDSTLRMVTEMYCSMYDNDTTHGYNKFISMMDDIITVLLNSCIQGTTLILELYDILDDSKNIYNGIILPEYERRNTVKKFRHDVIHNSSVDILTRFLDPDIISVEQLTKEFGITRELLNECIDHCKEINPDLTTRFRNKTYKLKQYASDITGVRSRLKKISSEFNKIENPTLLDFCKLTKYSTKFIKNAMNDPNTPYTTWGDTPEEALRFCQWINRHSYQDEESISSVTDIINNGHLIYRIGGEYRELSTQEKTSVMEYMKDHVLPLSPELFVQVCREYVRGNININK